MDEKEPYKVSYSRMEMVRQAKKYMKRIYGEARKSSDPDKWNERFGMLVGFIYDVFPESEEKLVLYRCGWCGLPTDKHGEPIKTDKPDLYIEEMIEKGAAVEHLSGDCCPNGDGDYLYQSPSQDMLSDAGML